MKNNNLYTIKKSDSDSYIITGATADEERFINYTVEKSLKDAIKTMKRVVKINPAAYFQLGEGLTDVDITTIKTDAGKLLAPQKISNPKNKSKDADAILKYMRKITNAPDGAIYPQMKYIYFDPESKKAVATDAHRLIASGAVYDAHPEFAGYAVNFETGDKELLFEDGQKHCMSFGRRWPDWKNAMPKDCGQPLTLFENPAPICFDTLQAAVGMVHYDKMPDAPIAFNMQWYFEISQYIPGPWCGVSAYKPIISQDDDLIVLLMPMMITDGGTDYIANLDKEPEPEPEPTPEPEPETTTAADAVLEAAIETGHIVICSVPKPEPEPEPTPEPEPEPTTAADTPTSEKTDTPSIKNTTTPSRQKKQLAAWNGAVVEVLEICAADNTAIIKLKGGSRTRIPADALEQTTAKKTTLPDWMVPGAVIDVKNAVRVDAPPARHTIESVKATNIYYTDGTYGSINYIMHYGSPAADAKPAEPVADAAVTDADVLAAAARIKSNYEAMTQQAAVDAAPVPRHRRRLNIAPRLSRLLHPARWVAVAFVVCLLSGLLLGMNTSTAAADDIAAVYELHPVTVTAEAPDTFIEDKAPCLIEDKAPCLIEDKAPAPSPVKKLATPSPVKNVAEAAECSSQKTDAADSPAGEKTASPMATATDAAGLTICEGTPWAYTMMNWA